ncbi:MAG: hypothetical protein R3F49_23185 [Planctomycetota bacterium]
MLTLSVPAGVEHQWFTGSSAPAVLRPAPTSDFTFRARFDSDVRSASGHRLQGLVLESPDGGFLRFELLGAGARVQASASLVEGGRLTPLGWQRVASEAPWTLELVRVGAEIECCVLDAEGARTTVARASFGGEGANHTTVTSPGQRSARIGVYAGNAFGQGAPEHTAKVGAIELR